MNCHTCNCVFQATDKILQQHGVLVCANTSCCWANYKPPAGTPPNWKLGPQKAFEYREFHAIESYRLKAQQMAIIKSNLIGLSFMDKLVLLFRK